MGTQDKKKLFIQETSCFPLIFILDYLLSDDTEGHNCTLLSGWLLLRGSWIAQPTSCSFSQIIKRTGLRQNRLLKHPAGYIKQPSSLGQALPKTPNASSCLRTTRVYCCCPSTPASSFISFSLCYFPPHSWPDRFFYQESHTFTTQGGCRSLTDNGSKCLWKEREEGPDAMGGDKRKEKH